MSKNTATRAAATAIPHTSGVDQLQAPPLRLSGVCSQGRVTAPEAGAHIRMLINVPAASFLFSLRCSLMGSTQRISN